jgi:hypothetical protein
MKKTILALLLALAWVGSSRAQSTPVIGSGSVFLSIGAPTGTCNQADLDVNVSTGDLYSCNGGSWLKVGPGAAGSAAFNTISGGTNVSAAMIVGTGASLTVSGSGTINATSVNSNTFPASAGFTSGGIPYFSSASAVASSAALTANLPVIGGGAGAAPSVGTRTGNTTQFATWTGATTAARCVDTDVNGNLQITAGDCGTAGVSSLTGTGVVTNSVSTGAVTLTVAGTSGGIVYFSSASAWASSGALTASMPVIGGGAGVAPTVGTVTGNTTQFATWTGATTASRCVDTDVSGNLHITAADCGSAGVTSLTGSGVITNSSSTGAVTLTIAGTSGGIVYFSSASAWASSGALTANVLVKGGGAGVSPANSSVTDNGTTVSTAEPVQVTSDGTHPGNVSFAGNTTVVAPATNTFNIMGPSTAAFTAYALQFPNAAPAAGTLMQTGAPTSAVSQVTYTATPVLGVDGSVAGTLQLANSAASFHTIISSGATANWTMKLPATAGTNLFVLQTDGSGNTSWVAQSGGGVTSVFTRTGAVVAAANDYTLDLIGNLAAAKTFANGNFPLIINCALTSGTTCLTTGETTAATTAGAVEHQITTLTTSTAIALQITQGAAGPANAAAPNIITVSAAAAGGAAGASNAGSAGAGYSWLSGNGSAGGATTGNGGAGGNWTITEGNGGAGGGTTTNNGGNGGGHIGVTGNGGNAAATGTSGNGGNFQVTLGVGGTTGTTPGTNGQFLVTSTAPASVSVAAGIPVGTMFNVVGIAGGASSNAAGTGGIGSIVTLASGAGGAGTGTNAVGGAGAAINLTAGNGGGSLGTGVNSNGGNIALTVGSAGTGGSGTAGKAGVVSVTGPTAGLYYLTQGTVVTTLNTQIPANSYFEYAPTAVTAYGSVIPGAAPNIASYIQTDGCASALCTETYHPVPVLLTVTGDFTDSTSGSLQLITGLSTTLPVSKAVVVSFHCALIYDQTTAAVVDQFGIGITGTAPTQANAAGTVQLTAGPPSTFTSQNLTGLASTTPTLVVSFTPGVAATLYRAELDGTVEQPSNATPGVFGIYAFTTTGTDNFIVKRGSYCSVLYQ